MSEPHVIGALRRKRSELGGVVNQLEQRLAKHRADLAHLDATMRLCDPSIRPQEIRPRHRPARSMRFRPGECLRLIYDELRGAPQPMTTRELAVRLMRIKAMRMDDDQEGCAVYRLRCNRDLSLLKHEGRATIILRRWLRFRPRTLFGQARSCMSARLLQSKTMKTTPKE